MIDKLCAISLTGLLLMILPACGDDPAATPGDTAAADTALNPDSAAADADAADTASVVQSRCLSPEAPDPSGTDRLDDPLGAASVTLDDRDACWRTYTLSSTASRRDDLPTSPRAVVERDGDPTLRSGHDLLDALHALAVAEARENMVDAIRDGAFAAGQSVPCGDGGCFETGRKWTYVWTRDTAYAVDLGLAGLDPVRAGNSLAFKLSERRAGGGREIVQDTGTGGSHPVSTDRVAWALGAETLLAQLDGPARDAFRALAWDALQHTLERDRVVVYDPTTGLYRGETSFLDWREQTYPAWTELDTIDIATGAALGTNVLHVRALELAASLGDELGETALAARYRGWATALRDAVRAHFWQDADGLFSSFLPSAFDLAPVRRYDLLSQALAVLSGVATPDEARRILAAYPHYGPGAPVIWPQQQRVAIYHNRAEWPFVDAYWLRAAAHAGNDAVADRMVGALLRAAALNLSNMENLEAWTGAPWLEDDVYSGPVVNSQRQLWSVAGFLSMVHRTLFGLEPTASGLRVTPFITHGMRRTLFAGTDEIVLNDFAYRGRRVSVVIALPPLATAQGGGAYRVASRRLDGQVLDTDLIAVSRLAASSRVDVVLEPDPAATAAHALVVDAADWRRVFGPRTPQLKSVSAVSGKLSLELGLGGEDPAGVLLHIYRDGVQVASGLPADTGTWVDPDSDAGAPRSPCYAVEASFSVSGNRSQHSRAVCWWGSGFTALQTVDAGSFTAVGGTPVTEHGRFHYQSWGDAGHTLTASGIQPVRSGPFWLQVRYGNGAGPLNTGITCAVKRISVFDEATGTEVGTGVLVMPHLGSWQRWTYSSVVPVTLDAQKRYRVVLSSDDDTVNMSAFAHFATYSGGSGGTDGAFNRVNIAELRLLAR